MSKLIPDYVFDSIYDITPEVLTAHGVHNGIPQGRSAARYAAHLC